MSINKIVESSVQVKQGAASSLIFRMASQYDAIPAWWSPERDAFFRKYWYEENFLASAIYAIANRNSAYNWKFTGVPDDIKVAQQLLQFANFGDGWQSLINKFTVDYTTQDNGAFLEIIRPARVLLDGKRYKAIKGCCESSEPEWFALSDSGRIPLRNKNYTMFDSPLDLPIGIANLDAGLCQRTGDPDTPIIYTDIIGKRHVLKWWQVLQFCEMPSPISSMNGVGYSAMTRLFRASHTMQSISLYNDEKVSGRFNRAIHLTNIDPDAINDAISQANEGANNSGLMRYSQPIIAATHKLDSGVALETINLAEIPDNFDFNDLQNWYVATVALALGVDYGFLAPLPGKGLGTASQSETMQKQSKGKSSRLFMDSISNAFNFRGIFPKSVQFKFKEKDYDEEEREEKQRKTRADRFKIYIDSGIITPQIALQMASDNGDIDQDYVKIMGAGNVTPEITIDGDTNINSYENGGENEVIKCCDHKNNTHNNSLRLARGVLNSINYEQIQGRKEKLFKKNAFIKRIQNVASGLFGKKQEGAQDTEVEYALGVYDSELKELFEKANSGEIEQSEFETQLTEIVIDTLLAFYAQSVGKEVEDLNEQDIQNVESEIAVNLESVMAISDDIYSGNYVATEDNPDAPLALISRVALWMGSALFLSWLGMIWNDDNKDKLYQWNLNPIKENCESCIALDGQVHTALAWREFGVLPQSTSLACFGKHCGCYFSEVSSGTLPRGDLSTVPLR